MLQLFLAVVLLAVVPIVVFTKTGCRQGASVVECFCRKGSRALVVASGLAFLICAWGAYELASEKNLPFFQELLKFWKIWTISLVFALLLKVGEFLAKRKYP